MSTKNFVYSLFKDIDKADPKEVPSWQVAQGEPRDVEMIFQFFPADINTAGTEYQFNIKLTNSKKQALESQGIQVLQDEDSSIITYNLNYNPDHIEAQSAPASYVYNKIYFINNNNADINDFTNIGQLQNLNQLLININSLEKVANKIDKAMQGSQS